MDPIFCELELKTIKSGLVGLSIFFPMTANAGEPITEFAQNVVTHVMLHELAHGLFREFDLPILANEEVMADTFATYFVTQHLRDDAPNIIVARAKSWIFEDSQVPLEEYNHKTEHPLDIRRAYQTLCLFYGADPTEFSSYVAFAGFSPDDLTDCSDTAPDQIAAWDDVVNTLQNDTPVGSGFVEVIYGEGPMKTDFMATGVMDAIADIARSFPWPQGTITLQFDHCDAGASWSRSDRKVLLCDDYVTRFIQQGKAIAQSP